MWIDKFTKLSSHPLGASVLMLSALGLFHFQCSGGNRTLTTLTLFHWHCQELKWSDEATALYFPFLTFTPPSSFSFCRYFQYPIHVQLKECGSCFHTLQNNIWRSSIRLETKIRLLNVYVLPVLLYGAETWSLLHLQRVTNTEVLRRTNQTQLSTVPCNRRLLLFGHVARSDARMDHSRALHTVISGLPSHWRRPPGRPRQSWTRTIEKDPSALSIGLPPHGTSLGSWTMATNHGSGYAPSLGLPLMMMMAGVLLTHSHCSWY